MLTAPDPRAQMAMITGPATVAGLELEGDLALRILYDTEREPGALALMAYTLSLLWERRQDGKLTCAAYDDFGGVQGAIQEKAEQTYEKLVRELGKAAEDALGGVFSKLVEVDPERNVPTRKRAAQKDFEDSPAALSLIKAFSDREARLLVCDKGVVEVAHEALLTNWKKLADWIESTTDDFRLLKQVCRDAKEWDSEGQRDAYLWSEERRILVWPRLERLKPRLEEVERRFVRLEITELIREINNPTTQHQRRQKIGERMSHIDDLRHGVKLRADGLPDIAWCEVSGGSITLEGITSIFQVEPFHIAKYPVTYGQYRSFLEAKDGYRKPNWWQGLAKRSGKPSKQHWAVDNHPAENVSWFEAIAFCRWLNEKLADEIHRRFGDSRVIRLPTEWEWQQAATGGQSENEYPWGPDWDSSRANTSESGLNHPTAVGMYPEGASSVGALDMAGNIWEWCLNDYVIPKQTDLSGSSRRRVVRGGSWFNTQDNARAAFRGRVFPGYRYNFLGFQVVCSPPILNH